MGIHGYLLDTNIAIAALSNDEAVSQFTLNAEKNSLGIFFSIVTQCEVLSGAKSEIEWKRLSKIFPHEILIDADQKVAESASIIRYQQRLKQRKLKTPDALIIATALEFKLTLVSRDSDMRFVQKELDIPLLVI